MNGSNIVFVWVWEWRSWQRGQSGLSRQLQAESWIAESLWGCQDAAAVDPDTPPEVVAVGRMQEDVA